MNNNIYYILINIPNIQYHQLLHPITKPTKKDKNLLTSTKVTESLAQIFGPTTEINNLPLN